LRTAVTAVLVLCSAAAYAAGERGRSPNGRESSQWRSLAYQLPKAYRFLDRLDLTAEQKKALSKVYEDWRAARREAYRKVSTDFPRLSREELKDPEKVKAYYLKRAESLKAAQVPPPLTLVDDILSEEQLARIGEANKVIDVWEAWLAKHLAEHEKKLDALLGPTPDPLERSRAYALRVLAQVLPGGSELPRLKLTDEQFEKLDALRKSYYARLRNALAPLTQSVRSGAVNYRQLARIRPAISSRTRDRVQQNYREQVLAILTDHQRKLLEEAAKVIAERDNAIWEHYARFLEELAAILPEMPASPVPAEPDADPQKPKK
jgi:Spy/CpxP family protein refolding chaperone